jgi:ATPase subunit of ABC transporter with duplicated ATPase domains
MLRRIYVDNFLSLVGFDLKLSDRQLLLGRNGMGKSSLFRAIRAVRDVVEGGRKLSAVFGVDTLTRWQSLRTQRFELDVELPSVGPVRYVLVVEHTGRAVRTVRETLHGDGGALFEYADGRVRLFTDDHALSSEFPLELEYAPLGTLVPGPVQTRLAAFRRWLGNLYVLRIDSPHIVTEAGGSDLQPLADDSTNFPAWYQTVAQSDQKLASDLRSRLTTALPGFVSLNLPRTGNGATMLVPKFEGTYERASGQAGPVGYEISYRFDELSDGQRSLIVLYALLCFALKGGHTLCLDQPDEYVSIEEIQPWLMTALDELDAGAAGQLLLISHHPELINVLAPEHGLWFERPTGAGTRVRPFAALPNSPLQPAEQIAWGENNADG